ncbi:MAG: stage II sporulation protein D [Clostridium argentinense]|uniref:Stage II sporulation protein D n=1 Tax=Clostridium faecium TaxID=2762223 RepID=A0ABR8YTM6_9CLOT|nr:MULTISPECIES: stage II sporulation protein D [Clostridium]MBD8047611.1 stage II sporulation protein D [Clostridium faecium]MBS5823248.1 stage II sporulation protein D [Clostridium argentinense]MDU1349658.1 stage II sporulation protein D [Clostridium argentinense]
MRSTNSRKNIHKYKGIVSEDLASQIIRVLVFLLLGFVFLLISTYFILGNEKEDINNSSMLKEEKINIKNGSIEKAKSEPYNINIPVVKIYLTKENRIIELPLEEYIKGVVSSEMPINFELEALKAQAVAARTYTIAHTKILGGGCSKGNGADLCDTIHCQVYMSKEKRRELWGESAKKNWNKVEEAVKSTEGQIITYNNELARGAYYFSTSSGRTENSEDIFVNALPYLRSVESYGEDQAPRYKTVVKIPYSELVDKANRQYNANMKLNNIKSQINILERTEGGSVKEIKLGDVIIPGTKFRTLYNLNSANFTLNFLDNELEIACNGFGHGVGMSQWGANAMAKDGKTYKDILSHYYQGVEVTKINR